MAKIEGIENRTYTVYAIRCTESGRMYVGSSYNVQNRIYQHFVELRAGRKPTKSTVNGFHSGELWQSDFDKYGEDAFEVYILQDGVPHLDRRRVEAEWIARYKATDPEYGYNARNMQGRPDFQIKPGRPPIPMA